MGRFRSLIRKREGPRASAMESRDRDEFFWGAPCLAGPRNCGSGEWKISIFDYSLSESKMRLFGILFPRRKVIVIPFFPYAIK